QYKDMAHIACRLETGRTHQIRVHMAYIGHAILGDPVYGPSKMPFSSQTKGQLLHAGILGFTHPRSGERLHFEAPLPEYFTSILTQLEKES
ncbi:MAG: RNA pseudouridine synthase, partial [Lachnospiraceae bacterium]|nr:RNA pseudouridine synthase [Lachnospiraceae bacterium]